MFDTITVAATYINDTTIVCITPAHAVGSVPVSVSNDGYEWAVISMPFNVTLPINVTVSDIEPSVGWTGAVL